MENEEDAMMNSIQIQDKEEEDIGSDDSHLALAVSSRVFYMLGDIAGYSSSRFTQWLEMVRQKKKANENQNVNVNVNLVSSDITDTALPLWDRLGKASMMDIESSSFSWDSLSSLHHSQTQDTNTSQHSDTALEVTVNSGGLVFFAFFTLPTANSEGVAVIKLSSSRIATQSERLGYEFANCLGVPTPQARVIHNSTLEWLHIKEAATKARDSQVTCSELLEALELSRCLFLMSYVHGSPLLETCNWAHETAGDLGRVLLLDLVIRNEDRLPCRLLRWRGNPANLLLAHKRCDIPQCKPRVVHLQKETRASSVDSSDLSDITESPKSSNNGSPFSGLRIVAIDSGVPRRPPAGKRANDQATYPKLVELLLNSPDYASNLLSDITAGKLPEDDTTRSEMGSCVQDFRNGFRAALRDLQGFHIFLLTLHQKLDCLVRVFMNNILGKMSLGESDKDDPPQACPSPPTKDHLDLSDSEQRSAPRCSSDSTSPMSRDNWHGRASKGSSDPLRNLRLSAKLRDFHRFARVDAELSKELEQWNEMLKNDVVRVCQEKNFNTGFFEGSDNNWVIDAYEMKVRLEHILERVGLISEAANTERPSRVTSTVFIGGALAARSVFTLQHLGITHILCLCSNEIGQSDSQYPELFEYRNFSISDREDENISSIFEEASEFVEGVEERGGKVLVHCFEGRSRSATVVMAYLMLKKEMRLVEAWNSVKKVHRRAQPNDGFAKTLQRVEKKVHGKVSMEWQQRKPMVKVCPVCGKNAGLSTTSLKLHLQKSHKKVSSGSVDSAMTVEIQKALTSLNITRTDAHLSFSP